MIRCFPAPGWAAIRAVLLALLLSGPVRAQEPDPTTAGTTVQPRVTAELTPETAPVGQPLVLRIKILVPTWLPSPPTFPAMDIPNVIVRLPERATGPISESVDGETWSGVSRAYRLYPMVPGEVALPVQTIGVTYADPDTTQPVSYAATLDPIRFTATIPEGAEGLDPLIVASGLTLEQSLDGAEETLGQGDAVVRTVTATISGTSPIFIPPLIPQVASEAFQSYPKDGAVSESEDRGVLSGSRTDTTTYVARYGGSVDLPEIAIDWFNVETGQVETARVDGATLSVDAPGPPVAPVINPRQVAVILGALIVLWLAVRGARKYLLPPLRHLRDRQAAAWEASEAFAARQVRRAIGNHDLAATHTALGTWSERCPGSGSPDLEAALARIGAQSYRGQAGNGGDWAMVSAAFQSERDRRLAESKIADSALPPLNPR